MMKKCFALCFALLCCVVNYAQISIEHTGATDKYIPTIVIFYSQKQILEKEFISEYFKVKKKVYSQLKKYIESRYPSTYIEDEYDESNSRGFGSFWVKIQVKSEKKFYLIEIGDKTDIFFKDLIQFMSHYKGFEGAIETMRISILPRIGVH